MEKQLSVCMVASHLPPEYTGAGQQALTLAQSLKDKINIFVVCEHGSQKPGKVIIDGLEVYRLSAFAKRTKPVMRKILFALNLLFFLIRNNKRYDIIHCIGGSFIMIPAVMAAKLLNKKICVKLTRAGIKGDDPDSIKKRNFGKIVYQILLQADAIICITQQLYDICIESGISKEQLFQIPNGVDTDFFSPVDRTEKENLRQQLNLPHDALIVCFNGIAGKRKRVDFTISAVAKAASDYPNLFLLVVGPRDTQNSEYANYLNILIETSSISDRIFFTGFCEFQIAKKYLQASDIFLLPSSSEGLPNSLLEAMSCGLCCVVTDTPPLNQLLANHHDGWLIHPEHADEFNKIVQKLDQDKRLMIRMVENARQKIQLIYDIDKVTNIYIDCYNKKLNNIFND